MPVNSGWKAVDSKVPMFTYEYSFGPGRANALAIQGAKGFLVVSPPCRAPDAAFDELEGHGKIAALIAPNAYHNMGIAPWKARFKDVPVFAPAQSIARVAKKSQVADVRPVTEARDLAGDVELVDMPHFKTGEVLVRARAGDELVWYVVDTIVNMPSLPKPALVGLLFKWTGSAPGLKLNRLGTRFMAKDMKALHGWLRDELDKAPPSLFVPCHGPPIRMAKPGAELRSLF